MSTLTKLSQAEAAALAEQLLPHLHPLARQRVELLREQEQLIDDVAELEHDIADQLPAAQAATAKKLATAEEIETLKRRHLLEQRESNLLWAPIEDMRLQKGRKKARLQDIPLELAAIDKSIAGGTTLRPRP